VYPVSQVTPVNAVPQTHLNPVVVVTHKPPFKQGLTAQLPTIGATVGATVGAKVTGINVV